MRNAPPHLPGARIMRSNRIGVGARAALGGLVRRVERGGAALLEIAEGQHTSAQLRERALVGQRKTAYLLRRFFCGGGFDLAPIVHGAPLPVGPVLHLVSLLGLHLVPRRSLEAARGYKPFLATIGPVA